METQLSETGRRTFLRTGGAVLAAAAAGMLDAKSAAARDLPRPDRVGLGLTNDHQRAARAYGVRQSAALAQRQQPMPAHLTNGDETRYPNRIGNYSKGLPHDQHGLVERSAYDALVRAMQTGDADDFDAIPMGGVARQVNPQGALAFELVGPDSHHLDLRPAPALASAEAASEMAEVYWLALTRDVPFADYGHDPAIAAAAAELSGFSDFRGPKAGGRVSPETIFRGTTPGDLTGPYLSQFLLGDVPLGPYQVVQRVRIAAPGVEYLTDYGAWLDCQNGAAMGAMSFLPGRRYIATGRDLAEYVHRDFSYEAFEHAALRLLGQAPVSPDNPYLDPACRNQAGFTTFGGPHVLDLVAHAANLALRAAWFQKWSLHRRLRPEAMGGLVHGHKALGRPAPLHPELLRAHALDEVAARFGTYLLPMAYSEGCPTHPSYPAGHAAISGACATILKICFDESAVLSNPVVPDATGSALLPYDGPPLTVGGELNKLASNIALGRDVAGVHYRSDGAEGLLLGEAVAVGMVRDTVHCYSERITEFSFTSFSGTRVVIRP